MTEPGQNESADPASGVLGNLPRTRPAVRSPRRRRQPQPKPPTQAAEAASEPDPAGPGELESLARGGIAIAGGAASLGLRIAGRAAAAVRDAVDRR